MPRLAAAPLTALLLAAPASWGQGGLPHSYRLEDAGPGDPWLVVHACHLRSYSLRCRPVATLSKSTMNIFMDEIARNAGSERLGNRTLTGFYFLAAPMVGVAAAWWAAKRVQSGPAALAVFLGVAALATGTTGFVMSSVLPVLGHSGSDRRFQREIDLNFLDGENRENVRAFTEFIEEYGEELGAKDQEARP